MALDDIDNSLFLSDYDTFAQCLLPIVNKERALEGLPPLEGEQAMDYYLDLINEHRKTSGTSDNATSSEAS
jgi:hypothetical protein